MWDGTKTVPHSELEPGPNLGRRLYLGLSLQLGLELGLIRNLSHLVSKKRK